MNDVKPGTLRSSGPKATSKKSATQSHNAIPVLLLLNRLNGLNLSALQIRVNHLSITNRGQPSQYRLVDAVLNGNDVTVEKNKMTYRVMLAAEFFARRIVLTISIPFCTVANIVKGQSPAKMAVSPWV